MTIVTKQMRVEFTNEEKEIIRKFHKLIDEIDTAMLNEEIETVEINDNEYAKKEISEVEEIVWSII
jgi:hypothetical protein